MNDDLHLGLDDTEGHAKRSPIAPDIDTDTEGHGFRGPVESTDDDTEGHGRQAPLALEDAAAA